MDGRAGPANWRGRYSCVSDWLQRLAHGVARFGSSGAFAPFMKRRSCGVMRVIAISPRCQRHSRLNEWLEDLDRFHGAMPLPERVRIGLMSVALLSATGRCVPLGDMFLIGTRDVRFLVDQKGDTGADSRARSVSSRTRRRARSGYSYRLTVSGESEIPSKPSP